MTVARGRLAIQRLLKFDGTELLPLDLTVARDPEVQMWLADRVIRHAGDQRIVLVSAKSLRALKRLRGSPQDLADLEALGPDTP